MRIFDLEVFKVRIGLQESDQQVHVRLAVVMTIKGRPNRAIVFLRSLFET